MIDYAKKLKSKNEGVRVALAEDESTHKMF